MKMSKKSPSSNVVLLVLGERVVGRFEPQTVEKEDGTVTRQALTQATSFIKRVLADKDHELHEAMSDGQVELMNHKIQRVEQRLEPTLSIG